MSRSFLGAVARRHSYYALENESPIIDDALCELVAQAVKHVSSVFNSQSTRVVVLLGEHHYKLWKLIKDVLHAIAPVDTFAETETKISESFQNGYGTILYYEAQAPMRQLQEKFPTYADNFPVWSEHISTMHQSTIWTALEDAGSGISLQHYSPTIDEVVVKELKINADWKLRVQMPFGIPAGEPGEKTFEPLEERLLLLK